MQHQKQSNLNKSFDEISSLHNCMTQSDFLKFCKDFAIPLNKTDILEVYRKIVVKHKHKLVDFANFNEMLKEMFFVKDTEVLIKYILAEIDEMPTDKKETVQ